MASGDQPEGVRLANLVLHVRHLVIGVAKISPLDNVSHHAAVHVVVCQSVAGSHGPDLPHTLNYLVLAVLLHQLEGGHPDANIVGACTALLG